MNPDGRKDRSCYRCHSTPTGDQPCNLCHGNSTGDPTDPLNWAPPSDLAGYESGVNNPGIGAHQAHLRMDGKPYKAVECNICHNIPESWDSRGHIIDETTGKAEVDFSFPVSRSSWSGNYDSESHTCSSTWCHRDGNPVWTEEEATFDCTSCHGMPPGGGHYNFPGIENKCYQCHSKVIDESGTIVAPHLHVDGVVNEN